MKNILNLFSSILCILVLFFGILTTGCTDGHLDQVEDTEQGSEENQDKPTEDEEGDDSITYAVNDAWSIEFNSPGVVDGYEYDYVVSVNSTDDNYYFISLINEDYYQESEIDVLAPELYQFLLEMFEIYSDSYGYESIIDICYNESASQFYQLTPGNEYRAVVLGVTDKGELNGLYAVSEVIIPE